MWPESVVGSYLESSRRDVGGRIWDVFPLVLNDWVSASANECLLHTFEGRGWRRLYLLLSIKSDFTVTVFAYFSAFRPYYFWVTFYRQSLNLLFWGMGRGRSTLGVRPLRVGFFPLLFSPCIPSSHGICHPPISLERNGLRLVCKLWSLPIDV